MVRPPQVDRQREHQANERTFLAWLRTSIALIAFGFAIARFSLFLRQIQATMTQQAPQSWANSENLGLVFVAFGIGTIALAAWRYNQVFWQIERGSYQPNRLMVWIMTAVVMTLGTLSIPLLLWRGKAPNGVPPSRSPDSSSNSVIGGSNTIENPGSN